MSLENIQKYLNCYEFSETLPGSGKKVKIKPFNTFQLKKLLSYGTGDDDSEMALDDLIVGSVVDEGFNIDELYLEDRFFLLVAIRRRTKGNLYKFVYNCPKCSSQTMQSIDLSKLPTKKLGKHDTTIKLDDNIAVELQILTRGVQKAAATKVDKDLEYQQKMIDQALWSHALCIKKIVTPDGESAPTPEDAYEFVNIIPEGLYEKIRDWFVNLNFGVEFKYKMKCDRCTATDEVEISLESFLF